jgi:hypothetical protein
MNRECRVCLFTVGCVLLSLSGTALRAANVNVYGDPALPQTRFAADELEQSLVRRHHRILLGNLDKTAQPFQNPTIVLAHMANAEVLDAMEEAGAAALATLKPEGFCFRVTQHGKQSAVWVVGKDPAGLMYGGLELAEVIQVSGMRAIRDLDQNPYMALRGTKFNCPLDVRTPSYTDVCDAAQQNIGQMWNFEFWREYIDSLARYRYNYVSLWNLHPFPSLVQVPDYPEVALADVQRSTVDWQEHYDLQGRGFCDPEIINNVEVLKKMTIAEKIDFWRKVMRYGKERNVDFYFVTWNIFTYGTQGQYGITDAIDNDTTRDYFRKSVKQMFVTYPDLKGIGLTTGENMRGASLKEKEDWAFATYGQGVLDAVKELPDRKITFIHRQHMAGALDIADRFQPLIDHANVEFIFSFKYAKAHVYSSTTQPYHQGFVKDIQGRGDLKTIWTLRNDDIFHFRWGAPDFVREFIENIPHDVSRGYYYGSDQYIWGREFMSTEPEEPRQIEVVKHWYQWLLWGRLGYDPGLSNERLMGMLQARFPEVSGNKLFAAWQDASMIYPLVTGFHWGALDFQWYIESSQSRPGPAKTPTGFHDLNRFITLKPHATTGTLSIPDYVQALSANVEPEGTTPVAVSDQIHAHADRALAIIDRLVYRDSKDLRLTLGDIRSMAYLGKHYAFKIRAATELALFRATAQKEHQDSAAAQMRRAAEYWRLYASNSLTQYTNPLWTNRVGIVDWRKTMDHVLDDLAAVEGDRRLSSMQATPNGTILEAERANRKGMAPGDSRQGFTGSGYVEAQADAAQTWLVWTFEAQKTGAYLLELRYTLKQSGRHKATWRINGKEAGDMELWKSADPDTWVWDRKAIVLDRGDNTLRLTVPKTAQIDHLNVLYGGGLSLR